MKVKSAEKDQLISELRQQLYDLKNQERDYKGVHDEIINTENRFKLLSDDKVRSDMENRARLDRDMDEIGDIRRQIDDLKYMLSEKSKQNMDLQDEQIRSKRLLDDKSYEGSKLQEDSLRKGDDNSELSQCAQDLDREIEMLKAQRADNWREINRLKDINDMKVREHGDQGDRLKAIEGDLARSQARCDDLQKLIDGRTYDLRNKQSHLEETERSNAGLHE